MKTSNFINALIVIFSQLAEWLSVGAGKSHEFWKHSIPFIWLKPLLSTDWSADAAIPNVRCVYDAFLLSEENILERN